MMTAIVVLGILCVAINLTTGSSPPVVNIPSLGKIEGTSKTSLKGRTFYSFEGVPYARSPTGKYRFQEPAPVKPWQGIWEAKTLYTCMQNFHSVSPEDSIVGDEDCLYVNIYTTSLDPQANLDVVVYIHGGAFMFSSGGVQNPIYIMDRDVVFISLNYRLGPLGFLSTEDRTLPGNNGLKDQIFALRWISEHVKNFGGNPKSVTIIGSSAGGASVHFHYVSPKSEGLVHKGISQSGTMLNPWVLVEKPKVKTQAVATLLGCPINSTKQMVECLRKRPARQIVAAVKHFQPWLYNPFSPFGVVVDSWADDPVLPEHPYKLLRAGKVADLPWIVSNVNSEGLYPGAEFYSDEQYLQEIDSRWDQLLPHILDYNHTVDEESRDEVSQEIRQYYLGDESVTRESFSKLLKLLSERLFDVDIRRAAKMQAAVVKSPVYFYHFTYRGAHSKSEGRAKTTADLGASHADDTCYIFYRNLDVVSTENDRSMVEIMLDMVTSFAKNGEPSVPGEWSPLTKNFKDPLSYLKIESPEKLTMETLQLDNAKFWNALPIRENKNLLSKGKDEL